MLECNRRYLFSTLVLLLLATTANAQPYWIPVTPPPIGNKAFSIDTKDSLIFAATDSELYITSTDGIVWNKLNGLHGRLPMYQFFTSGPMLYATTGFPLATDVMTLNRSTDNGQTWDSTESGFGDLFKQNSCIVSIGVFDDNGFSYSSDNGLTWNSMYDTGYARRFRLCLWSPDYLICYVDSQGGNLRTVLSTNSGNTWRTIPKTEGGIDYNGTAFLTCSKDGFLQSTDTCQTWQLLSTDISNASFFISNKTIYAYSASLGIWYSINGGRHWQPMNDGLPNYNFKKFAIAKNQIYAQVGSEIYRTSFPSAVKSAKTSTVNLVITPNPITSTGQISYSLPAHTTVSLTIFDVLGRVVATPITRESQDAADHTLILDTRGFIPGSYYCQFDGDSNSILTKLLIVR